MTQDFNRFGASIGARRKVAVGVAWAGHVWSDGGRQIGESGPVILGSPLLGCWYFESI
jgi:hypothetical protein